MKCALVIAAIVVATISCFVDRRSNEFTCDTDDDCLEHGDRSCDDGFCVPTECPGVCDDCDPGKICQITCSNPNECRNGVTCPTGWNCEITCNQDCEPVTCSNAASCTVECNSTECGPLICGSASPCTCSGTGCL